MATWKEDIIQALKNLGGAAHRSKIHKEVARLRKGKLNSVWINSIQEHMQRFSSDSDYYGGKEDIFYMVEGKGKGVWGLRNYKGASIRDVFIKICNEYRNAIRQPLKNHPLADYTRKEIPKIFNLNAKEILSKYKVSSVTHVGNWSKIAWINIMDPRITNSARRGFYPVYLFHENGKKILFELGQGRRDLKKRYKKEFKSIVDSRAIILRNKVKEFRRYGFKPVTMNLAIGRDSIRKDWVRSGAFGKMYHLNNLPNEQDLIKDLKNMLLLYDLAIKRGGVSETIKELDVEEEEIEKSLKGTEKKAVRFHREKEKTYIKTDPALIKRLKKKYNYTCQACNLKFDKIYGNYSDKKDYIEAHHLIPKSEILRKIELGEELRRDESDFAILCANCHRMIHKYACPPLNEFKEKVIKQYKDFLKNK